MSKKDAEHLLIRYSPFISLIIILLAFTLFLIQFATNNPSFNSFNPVLIATTVILSLTVLAAFLLKDVARPLS